MRQLPTCHVIIREEINLINYHLNVQRAGLRQSLIFFILKNKFYNVRKQWWFKKFCKGDESLEDEKHSNWSQEADNDQLRRSLKLILLELHEKLPKNSTSTILWLFSIWSKLERWKSSISGRIMSWQKFKKSSFWSVIFSYSTQ